MIINVIIAAIYCYQLAAINCLQNLIPNGEAQEWRMERLLIVNAEVCCSKSDMTYYALCYFDFNIIL